MTNLPEAIAAKIREMNEQIIPEYVAIIPIAPMTALTVAVMRHELNEAVEALASGDVLRMIRSYDAIKDYAV